MFRLRLLGDPALLDEATGAHVQLWRPHVAVLAQLGLAPEATLSRSVLAGRVWSDSPESNARRSLRQALFRLRRTMGDAVLATGEVVRLDGTHLTVDAREFERLLNRDQAAEAMDWYRGPLLRGFSISSGVAFDQWADRERARLARRAAAACTELVERAVEAGDWPEAILRARRWLALDPCSEAAARQLIALRARGGDLAGALAFYAEFRARLRTDLDLDPGDETRQLVERLRQAEPPAPPPRRVRPAPPPTIPLVGREREFARISARWERAEEGRHQLVVLTGEPGIGKTRLAREFAGWAELRGATTLRGRAYPVEQGVPYAALTGILRAALDAPGLAAVDGSALGEIARIVPEVRHRFRSGIAPPSGDMETGRVRLLEALRVVLDNLAFEAPVLLVLDDLPWADEATLTALHYLWRNLDLVRLLLLTTARSGTISSRAPLHRMLRTIAREGPDDSETLALEPLGLEAIERLAIVIGTPSTYQSEGDPLPVAVQRESGGNPLFVLEALRARAAGLDSAVTREPVRAGVRELTGDLSTAAGHLLQAAAVLGRPFPLPLAAAVASLSSGGAVDALEDLIDRRLLLRTEYEYDFVHDLLRESVHDGMSPERRRLLHRAAWRRMAPDEGEEVGLERACALAVHAKEGGLDREAHRWLLRAADLARALFAGDEAERLLKEAAGFADSVAERRGIEERMGDLQRARSRFVPAALAYQRAIAIAEPATPARLRLRIKLLDAALRGELVSLSGAGSAIETLLEDAASAGSVFERDARMVAGNGSLQARELGPAEEHAVRAVTAARRAKEPGPLVRALLLRAQVGTLRGTLDDALPVLEEAVRIAEEHDLDHELCDAETELATELCRQGRWTEAIEGWSRAVRLGHAAGALGTVAVAHVNLSDVRLRRGEWEEADTHLAEAESLSGRYDFPHLLLDVSLNRALMAWLRGDGPGTIRAAIPAMERARRLGIPSAERAARALGSLAHLEAGDVTEARSVLEAGPDPGTVDHVTWGDDRELVVVARARVATHGDGDGSGATSLVTAAMERTTEPWAAAFLKIELSGLCQATDPAKAEELMREARTSLTALGAEALLARVPGTGTR